MNNWLIGIAAVLLLIVVVQYIAGRNKKKQLSYIYSKLEQALDTGSAEHILLFTSDLQLQALLNAMNRLLDENRQTKADYTRTEISIKKMLTNMSHDLKTPLTVVLGLTETISRDETLNAEERQRLLVKVHDKALEMLSLMNKFFDLAKLESGDQALIMSRINITEICKNSILFFYENIVSHGFEAAIDIPEHTVSGMGNVEALERIMNNLISNAIRYGSDGKRIGLSVREDAEYAYIEVWDQGKGINESQQRLIFERLYTLEDSRNHLYQGSGLGLTITKRLVELMGGTITVRSTPYEKTVFSVKLRKIQFNLKDS
ncbi:MAG: sensor histidine kinase [Paenibacillus sp.]|nr:sensor histidine kinase [Paenibacillus sp.]